MTEGDAAGTSYTVALATQPTSSVSVSITGHSGTDLSLDETTLTFTTETWNTAQTVTVTRGGGRRRGYGRCGDADPHRFGRGLRQRHRGSAGHGHRR